MPNFIKKNKEISFILFLIISAVMFFILLPKVLSNHYVSIYSEDFVQDNVSTSTEEIVFVPSYVSTPDPLKGIYMTSWIAGTPELRDKLVKIIEETEINSVVIDIKDYTGKIVFPIIDNPELKSFGSEEVRINDLQSFVEDLHKKGIYVIGRIAVFQDAYFVKHRPDLAVKNKAGNSVWKDRKGISWIDAGSQEYWDYIVLLSKEVRKIGFDEINFDYIRFPSDGNMTDISFPFSSTTPKHVVMKEFFAYLDKELEGTEITTSADLFGMVTTATDDMGIGQLLEDALPHFDYIMPMVYPSHYPTSFMNLKEPEAHPYEVIKFTMQSAIDRSIKASTTPNKLRPWLQDFGLRMKYGPEEVRAQIKATNDIGLSSWILWSASNKYTVGALNKEDI